VVIVELALISFRTIKIIKITDDGVWAVPPPQCKNFNYKQTIRQQLDLDLDRLGLDINLKHGNIGLSD